MRSAQAALSQAQHPATAQDLAQARDAANQAEAAVTQAEQSLSLAQHPYTRQDIDQATLAVANAQQSLSLAQQPYSKEDLQQAQAAVDQAQASVDQAKETVKEATVHAPVAGVVTATNVSAGALVTSATTLLTLASQTVQVALAVPEGSVAGVKVGIPAQITVGTAPPVGGTVTSVAPGADPKSRTFQVMVTPQETSGLKAGTFATVTMRTAQHTGVLAVPKAAVVQRSGQNVVFVVTNGVAKAMPVTLGLANATLTEVTKGLTAGAQVVAQGQDTLVDGDHVSIAKAS